jgi:CheY-like chemotaxis protein
VACAIEHRGPRARCRKLAATESRSESRRRGVYRYDIGVPSCASLAAGGDPRDIEKGLEAGFFRYLTKPIKVNEFMETLDVALEFAGKTLIGTH